MKAKRLRALACLGILILGATLIIGCAGGAVETPPTSHFAAGGVSFDYPSTWDTLASDAPARIAYFSEIETGTVVQVMKNDMPADFTLKTYHDNMAISLMEGEPIWGKSLTVAGVTAYETGFNTKIDNQDWQMRLVSFEKGGKVYDIAFATVPASFDEANDNFDTVINSFEVQ